MIPKTIHYCWFGRNLKPKLALKCIKSWKKYCSDYQIIEWNEDNFDIAACPLYVRQAYEAKKWAFVTDYVRLKVVYEYGGIYLDTDVELINPLDAFLGYDAFFSFENGIHIATGLGFGAKKEHPALLSMMQDYEKIPFIRADGSYDTLPCPQRNTNVLLKYGLKQDDSKQVLQENILILPSEYMCPISYSTGLRRITKNTVSIHWFSSSWMSKEAKLRHKKSAAMVRKNNLCHWITHLPNLLFFQLLGKEKYEKLKKWMKRE